MNSKEAKNFLQNLNTVTIIEEDLNPNGTESARFKVKFNNTVLDPTIIQKLRDKGFERKNCKSRRGFQILIYQ